LGGILSKNEIVFDGQGAATDNLECGDMSPPSEGATRRADQSADMSAHSKESGVVPPHSKGRP